jgi:hypothetical protein
VCTADGRARESLAIGVSGVGAVVSIVAALLVFRRDPAPIAGPGSAGQFAAIAATAAAIVVFVFGRYVVRDREHPPRLMDLVDLGVVALAHAVIALLSWTLLSAILAQSFPKAVVYPLPLLFAIGAVTAVTTYVVLHAATGSSLMTLAVVLAVFLAEGLVASMLSASNPHWWRDNLSALGMSNGTSALTFNLTLIVAGMMITTLTRYITRALPGASEGGIARLRLFLVMMGVLLAFVGLFPVDVFFWVHTLSASGMGVVFCILALRVKSWMPGMAPGFIWLGRVFVGITVLIGSFYAVGYYTLTAVELIAAVMAFAWIILFIRNTALATVLVTEVATEPLGETTISVRVEPQPEPVLAR